MRGRTETAGGTESTRDKKWGGGLFYVARSVAEVMDQADHDMMDIAIE